MCVCVFEGTRHTSGKPRQSFSCAKGPDINELKLMEIKTCRCLCYSRKHFSIVFAKRNKFDFYPICQMVRSLLVFSYLFVF